MNPLSKHWAGKGKKVANSHRVYRSESYEYRYRSKFGVLGRIIMKLEKSTV